VKYCNCGNQDRQIAEGVEYCGACGERIPDPLLVVVLRKVNTLGKNEAGSTSTPALQIPSELIEVIAERAAVLVADRMGPTNADDWLRGAQAIADYIGSTRSRVYALASCHPPRIPVHHDGSALIARRSELDAWLLAGGGVRP
jgi:hypothetical protein